MTRTTKKPTPLARSELLYMLLNIRRKGKNLDKSLTSLTRTDQLVLIQIVNHSANMPYCGFMAYPSRETLSEKSGASVHAITDSVKRLVKHNWIYVYRNYIMNKRNEYYINAQKIVDFYVQTSGCKYVPDGIIFPTPPSVIAGNVVEDQEEDHVILASETGVPGGQFLELFTKMVDARD